MDVSHSLARHGHLSVNHLNRPLVCLGTHAHTCGCGNFCANGCRNFFKNVRADVRTNFFLKFFCEKMCACRRKKMVCGCVRRTLRCLCNLRAGGGQNHRTLKVCTSRNKAIVRDCNSYTERLIR